MKKKETPFVSFGNEELESKPLVKEGNEIVCPSCGILHAIEYGTSNGKKSDLVGFYRCGKKLYLALVGGKLVI